MVPQLPSEGICSTTTLWCRDNILLPGIQVTAYKAAADSAAAFGIQNRNQQVHACHGACVSAVRMHCTLGPCYRQGYAATFLHVQFRSVEAAENRAKVHSNTAEHRRSAYALTCHTHCCWG